MQKWYIIFRSYQGNSRILKWVLKRGFGHVSIIKKTDKHFIAIEQLVSFIEVEVIENFDIENILKNNIHDMTILYAELPISNQGIAYHFANYIPTCVTCAKSVLGIRCWSLTPFGLYKKLLSLNAVSIVKLK